MLGQTEDNPKFGRRKMNVAIYLRKSRADIESEKRGEGETLAKHKKALLELAKQKNLNILKVYEEIASGESLIHRPEMMKLLKEVEKELYDAVVCMDMDRLGRGNMREQGIILETFQSSGTKIITPRKTYDLDDEFDEEYSEFEAFMARKELKIINRRLQGGRVRSVKEGNYIATRPPYGYQIKKDKNGRYLVPDPEQAPVVKMIFDWYTHPNPNERMGTNKIAHRLNELGYLTYTGQKWDSASVLTIIKNEVYIGRIQWKKKASKKINSHKREVKARDKSEWIDAEGKHKALIDLETFKKAKEILKTRSHTPYVNRITNPLAGLIVCEKCGYNMVYRPYTKQPAHLICRNRRYCDNKSSRFTYVEKRLLKALYNWLMQYKLHFDEKDRPSETFAQIEVLQAGIKNLRQEADTIEKQMSKLHDLLEREIYDEVTFLRRSKELSKRREELQKAMEENQKQLEKERKAIRARQEIIPKIEHALEIYPTLDDAKQKNALLKKVLEKCTYCKEKHQRNDEFSLTIYPKI